MSIMLRRGFTLSGEFGSNVLYSIQKQNHMKHVARVALLETRTVAQFGDSRINHQLKERQRTINSFFNHTSIDKVAAQPSVRLDPATILYSGKSPDGSHILRSAQFLHKELPVRIANRIACFRTLPFIVVCNPTIMAVHELYIRAFSMLSEFPAITDFKLDKQYSEMLRDLLDDHRDEVTKLASGFQECRKYIKEEKLVQQFLDQTLTSRLGIRMLAEHHLALHQEQPNHVGIINTAMKLKEVVDYWADYSRQIAEHKYGKTPVIKCNGHITASFPYIQIPIDYIIPELLKNAVRATIESHPGTPESSLPPVTVTIANNDVDFILRVSDRGGGIPHHLLNHVTQYHFTTASHSEEEGAGVFSTMISESNHGPSGPMHGFGFGLPTTQAYAEYLGGNLTIETMQGIGTDVYLRLKHIDGKKGSFRI
ncbi:3-methyl-2-oxobutanoate dehydrogenase [lipoamide] kinase, mitochondrial-like [Limulus polyphemus]|uniref:Protein-serine/threonine kinase n=1 Tax=Limulus polyphemus TaxID=6850 RepID=A0ABM1S9A4_LIMPO|nr:3-methyl-2-oxobutanoate dehydrogenase [lipoamide] kinase, mitochondrial-like [Limulus polyphemus]XP_022240206.1 3-methyl-2-oxobutanoate dehydrogenase [lipoamide] kinase, mitochondrial-like [Limulus polyphemus]XP_022240207.1 3-methyl-2-oxobutanoate dehydrogenase [lipoamide] kinase, mitochondrial-like [Limulus polyphemus]XP_022240208.1 3-methyl-2-oxobutanoate dehydrogenase [lipoamide] kinase, mitochondrial-like [Limulus polyphemus]XP_022240209.1 3-methyl-2-oxobutanoate dehydrogenase [lipoamide